MPTYEFLAPVSAWPIGVDTDAKIIRGVIVAQACQFQDPVGEPDPRGAFDGDGLKTLNRLMTAEPIGVKSRYGHPNPQHPGAPAELDGFLGRFKGPRIDSDKLRSDLHLDDTAFLAPPGGGTSRGEYLMARAKSDPSSFGTSLVLVTDKIYRMDTHNKPRRDDNGNTLAPLWKPTAIGSIDIVDRGAATPAGFLAAAGHVIDGDELLRLRHSWRQKMLANEAPPSVEDLRIGWRNLQRTAGVESLSDTAGDNTIKASGFIPAPPPSHSGGHALPGSFRAPLLSDFTSKPWESVTIDDRRKIASWFAWAKSLESFGDLHLPFRFATGPARGHASLTGVRAAMARLNQVAGMSAAEREKVRKHLESFLPGGFRKTH